MDFFLSHFPIFDVKNVESLLRNLRKFLSKNFDVFASLALPLNSTSKFGIGNRNDLRVICRGLPEIFPGVKVL